MCVNTCNQYQGKGAILKCKALDYIDRVLSTYTLNLKSIFLVRWPQIKRIFINRIMQSIQSWFQRFSCWSMAIHNAVLNTFNIDFWSPFQFLINAANLAMSLCGKLTHPRLLSSTQLYNLHRLLFILCHIFWFVDGQTKIQNCKTQILPEKNPDSQRYPACDHARRVISVYTL